MCPHAPILLLSALPVPATGNLGKVVVMGLGPCLLPTAVRSEFFMLGRLFCIWQGISEQLKRD